MAKNPENVLKLLNSLWEKAIPVAVKERNEMQKTLTGRKKVKLNRTGGIIPRTKEGEI
ncbi:MAG: hypothetical protein U0X39_15620 [Bacteroidales bacterium]